MLQQTPDRSRVTQAAVVGGQGQPFVLRDVQLSGPRADEVIVQLEASGMCHADLAARSGALPFPLPGVLGHEGVGRIVETGASVTELRTGDRVVISFNWCGHCAACLRAAPVYCERWPGLNMTGGCRGDGSRTLSDADGPLHGHFFGQSSFSRFVVAAARAAVKVPDDVPAAVLAPLGCGVQTGVAAVTNVLRPAPGDRVAVFGAGAVGMSAIMGLGLTGAVQVIAIDLHLGRLALAQELGATDVIDAREGCVDEKIAELTRGEGLNGAVETSGNLSALDAAIKALAPEGTCVMVGVPGHGAGLQLEVIPMVERGLRLLGTNQGGAVPRVFIPRLVELYRAGRLPVEKIVTDFNFAQINEAAEASLSGRAIKPVLHMN